MIFHDLKHSLINLKKQTSYNRSSFNAMSVLINVISQSSNDDWGDGRFTLGLSLIISV